MIYLRQSTAAQEVPLGVFVDSLDGDTPETALTISASDIQVWKSGATALVPKNSGGATHMAGGVYDAVMDDIDTDTVGPLMLFVHVAGARAVRLECCVLAPAMYDWLFGTTAPLDAANTRDAVGLASANLDTQLAAIAAYIDTEVAAIKAKTDQLTFTTNHKVDATLQAASDLALAVAQKVADIVLRRVAANIEASSNGDALDEASLYGLIQRASMANLTAHAGKLTIYRSDGVTELDQVPIATDPDAEAITGFGG
jgi:hypothetical protein